MFRRKGVDIETANSLFTNNKCVYYHCRLFDYSVRRCHPKNTHTNFKQRQNCAKFIRQITLIGCVIQCHIFRIFTIFSSNRVAQVTSQLLCKHIDCSVGLSEWESCFVYRFALSSSFVGYQTPWPWRFTQIRIINTSRAVCQLTAHIRSRKLWIVLFCFCANTNSHLKRHTQNYTILEAPDNHRIARNYIAAKRPLCKALRGGTLFYRCGFV